MNADPAAIPVARLAAPLAGALLAALVLAIYPAQARQSDRNQPMDIDAGRQQGSLDDAKPTILSGGVKISQGTLQSEASVAEVSSRNGAISRVVLTGSPARLSQQMDDGSPMSAVANKVDYDVVRDVVVFTGNVTIQQPRGTLSGERVVYDMASGEVTSGGEGNGRVKMRIMPKATPQAAERPTGGG